MIKYILLYHWIQILNGRMTKKDILTIAIKIFGLYYFVRFVQHVMELFYMVLNYFDISEGWFIHTGITLTILIDIIFAYLAIFKTELIVNRISTKTDGQILVPPAKTDLLEIAFAIIAVLAIITAVPAILAHGINNVYFHDHKENEFWTTPTKYEFIRSMVSLAIGIFILLNSRNFSKWIVNHGVEDDKKDGKIAKETL